MCKAHSIVTKTQQQLSLEKPTATKLFTLFTMSAP